MQKNFSVPFTDIDGGEVFEKDNNGNNKKVMISTLVVNSLLGTYPDESNISGEDKIKRFCLAERVNEGGLREYTTEELVLIKNLAAKAFSTLATARIWNVCESDATTVKSTDGNQNS